MKGPNIPQTLCLLSPELALRAPLKQAKQGKIGGGKVAAPFRVRKPNSNAG